MSCQIKSIYIDSKNIFAYNTELMPSRYELEQRRRAAEQIKKSRNENQPRSHTRRNILLGAGGAAAAALVGFGAYELTAGKDTQIGEKGGNFQDVMIDYLEMKDKIVRQHGTITTPQKNVNYYNFTDKEFDPEEAKKVYLLAEQLKTEDVLIKFRLNGVDAPIQVDNPVKTLRLFIVDHDAPPTHEAGHALDDYGGYTGLLKSDNSFAYTVIRSFPDNKLPAGESAFYKSGSAFANSTLFTEACQASARASLPGTDVQETFCNSFGRMLDYVAKGMPFDQYRQVMKTNNHGIVNGQSVPLVPLSEEFYNRATQIAPFK